MELIEIEAFVEIADSGNFTRAAAALRISQPAISRRLELLERELGAKLFERSRGGTRLTDAGTVFLPFARQVLANARDGAAAVRELETGERGTVALALAGTLASTNLTTRLKAFRDTYPDIRLSLRTARSDDVSTLVQTGIVSLGLRYFSGNVQALVSARIADEDLAIVCAYDSQLVPRDATSPAVLANLPWVSFPVESGSSGEPFRLLLEESLRGLGMTVSATVAIDSLTAQKRMIEADFGLGLLPASSVIEEVNLGTLRVVQIEGFAVTAPVFVVRRRDGYLSAAARRLLNSLIEGFGPWETNVIYSSGQPMPGASGGEIQPSRSLPGSGSSVRDATNVS